MDYTDRLHPFNSVCLSIQAKSIHNVHVRTSGQINFTSASKYVENILIA